MTREQQALEALEHIRDYARTMSPELISTYAEDAIAALEAPEPAQPKGELTYVMSKDYEKLYEHLCKGGEALGLIDGPVKFSPRKADHITALHCPFWQAMMRFDKVTFKHKCQRLNLQYVALSSGEQPQQEPVAFNIEDEARVWYNERYGVDVDECGYGHSAKRAVGDLIEFALHTIPLYRSPQAPEPRLVVDQVMEFVKKWIAEMQPDNPIDPDEWNQPEWIKHESILRDRLTKVAQ